MGAQTFGGVGSAVPELQPGFLPGRMHCSISFRSALTFHLGFLTWRKSYPFTRRRPGYSLPTYRVRAGGDVCILRSVNASSWEVGEETFEGA